MQVTRWGLTPGPWHLPQPGQGRGPGKTWRILQEYWLEGLLLCPDPVPVGEGCHCSLTVQGSNQASSRAQGVSQPGVSLEL